MKIQKVETTDYTRNRYGEVEKTIKTTSVPDDDDKHQTSAIQCVLICTVIFTVCMIMGFILG